MVGHNHSINVNVELGSIGLLVDHQIINKQEEHGLIFPFDPERIQPASVDLTLAAGIIPVGQEGIRIPEEDAEGRLFHRVPAKDLVLASTIETISLPDFIAGRIEGKSTIGRRGLLAHLQAGFVDPGFEGQITLEIFNASNDEICIGVGEAICQICFFCLSAPADLPYNSTRNHYQGQKGPTPAAY